MVVMPCNRLLPLESPLGSPLRCRVKLDWAAASHDRSDVLTADEAEPPMVEVVAAEIIDHCAVRARCHERIDVDTFVQEDGCATGRLIGVVAPDDALAGLRIVGRADPRKEKHSDVVEREGGNQHQTGGLFELPACCIGISNAGGLFTRTVQIDAQDLGVGPQLIVWIFKKHRQNNRLWARLSIVFASIALAESAEDALL